MGPLSGVRMLEFGGIRPNPFAGMLFADMGADVLRLARESDDGIGDPARQIHVAGGRPSSLTSRPKLPSNSC